MGKKRLCPFFLCFSSTDDPIPTPDASPATSAGNASVPHDAISSTPSIPQSDLMEPILIITDDASSEIDLDGLISHITELLAAIKNPSEKKESHWKWSASSAFSKLREFLVEGSDFTSKEKDSLSKLCREAKTVAMSILKGIGEAHWPATGLVVVSSILERFEAISANNAECLQLLEAMNRLALHIKQLKDRVNLKEGMGDMIKEAVCMIVEGSIMCCTQMKSSRFLRFLSTSTNSQELLDLCSNLDAMYTRLMLQMGICIYDAINRPKTALPRHKAYPEHAVGIEEQFKKVIQLLELESEKNAVAVILHGFGGMGKTTLADAVFARLDINGFKFSTVRLFENAEKVPDDKDITELQKWILQELTGDKHDIQRFEHGQRLLGDVLKEKQAFIYIDNALEKEHLKKLLPEELNDAMNLRLLLTSRNEDVADVLKRSCGIKTCHVYYVEPLISDEAMGFFCKKMRVEKDKITSEQMPMVEKILGIYKGIPLVLDIVAGYIYSTENKDGAYRKIIEWQKTGKPFSVKKENNLEANGFIFAFEDLPESSMDTFHDICSFFTHWDWDKVAGIVGEEQLNTLKNRALLRKEKSRVLVHDVILRIGRNQTMGKRFTTIDGLREALEDNKDIHGIKGIWLKRWTREPFRVSAALLDSMHNSLRILSLGDMTIVDGKCSKKFEQLIYFDASDGSNIPFDISKLKKLRFLSLERYEESKDLNDLSVASPLFSSHSVLPPELRMINLRSKSVYGSSTVPFEITGKAVRKLPKLVSLTLTSFDGLRKLPEDISCWTTTERVEFTEVHKCRRNPTRLKQLPLEFGSLTSLEELYLTGCKSLKELTDSFGNILSLRVLNLKSSGLVELPDDIGNLKSLVNLNLNNCENLKSIPNSFGQLKSLVASIDMQNCTNLRELSEEFCNLKFIQDLSLGYCSALHKLPEKFKELINLKKLNLEHCKSLLRLHEGFNEFKLLEELNLSKCEILEELCNDFQHLASLQKLKLCGCAMLEGKWMESLVKIKTLNFVNIERSEMLAYFPFSAMLHDSKNVEKILSKSASPFFNDEWSLFDCHDKPFSASTLRCDTILLFVVHERDHTYCSWGLLENEFDEQISSDHNVEIIYIGQYFSEMPVILKDRTLAYASHNSPAWKFIDGALSMLREDYRSYGSLYVITAKVEEDEEGRKHFSSWEDLSWSLRKFVLSKSETYLRLKHLVETSSVEVQESNIKLLRVLLETDSEEKDFLLVKHNTDQKVNVEDLQGKILLLYISDYLVYGRSHIIEMKKMYVEFHDKYGYEIVSIPLNIERWSDFEEIVKTVPWPVMSNPWSMKSATMCFIEDELQCSISFKLVVVEPNGRISNKNALPMVERFGAEAYPFTPSREAELKVVDWDQLQHMSSVEFLFQTLEFLQTVQESVKKGKMLCFYGRYDDYDDTPELSSLLEVVGSHIQMVQVGRWSNAMVETSLKLSERDNGRFRTRLLYLMKEIKIEMVDSERSARLRGLLKSFRRKNWLSIIDEDGEVLTTRGPELVEFLICEKSEGDEEELRKEVIRCFKEGQLSHVKSLLKKKFDD
eukprot:Gb_34084 [translate_table: standard]